MFGAIFMRLFVPPASPKPLAPRLSVKGSMETSCDDTETCRTARNIVISSLITTFACTWVAIHPNISTPVDTRNMDLYKKYFNAICAVLRGRFPIFILVIVFPEFILAWAIRQRLMADWTSQNNIPYIMIFFLFFT